MFAEAAASQVALRSHSPTSSVKRAACCIRNDAARVHLQNSYFNVGAVNGDAQAIRRHLLLGRSGRRRSGVVVFPPLTEDVPARLSHGWISSITAGETKFGLISVYRYKTQHCNVITDQWGEQMAQMDSGNK